MRVTMGLLVVGALGLGCSDPRARRLAAKELGCAEEHVTVVAEEQSDTHERYAVEGCGKRGTLHCGAPDFECFLVPASP